MNTFKLEPLKLLVIGKTGVGKSAFCNFLFGQEVFESAAGRPVTEGIQAHQFKLEDTDIIVYDTEGIEVSNASEWAEKLDDVIGHSYKRTEKMHGIFYLVNASSARVEEFEINIIKHFSVNRNVPVFVILTHEDVAKTNQIISIQSHLKLIEGINIIPICCVQKKLRGGRASISNEHLKQAHISLTTLFLETAGRYYVYDNVFMIFDTFENTIADLRRKTLREISDADFSIFNITEWENKLEKVLDSFKPQLEEMSKQLQDISSSLAPHIKSNPFEKIIEGMNDNLDFDFEIDQIKSLSRIQKNADTLGSGKGFFSKLGAGLSLGYKAVTAESTVKEIAEDGIDLIAKFLNNKTSKTESEFSKESWVYKK